VKPPEPAPVVVVTPPPAPVPTKPEPPSPEDGIQIRAIDVVFVMDATMSMDEELVAVRSNMTSVVQVLRRLSDEVSVGFVAYIDRAVPWVIPLRPVTRDPRGEANLRQLIKGILEVELVGNEDWPEDVCGGLAKATSMSWPSALDRRQVIVLIGDARTHPADRERSLRLVKSWIGSQSQSRSVEAVFTPPTELASQQGYKEEIDASVVYFKDIARAGNGQFHADQGDLLGSILDILIVR
ncbi:MAG: VWA domain-containing protein, partial [Akkermansiaceae bacterium]|nr:VWA domain-containing protein [Akkermansiaceae bacterium]